MRALALLAVASLLAAPHAPYAWGHRLSESCNWRARPLLGLLGARGAEADRLQLACWTRRGLASPSPFVRTLHAKFPTEAELTAWRNTDAGAFHAR